MIDPADIQVRIENAQTYPSVGAGIRKTISLTPDEASLIWWALQMVKFAPRCHDRSFEVAYNKCMEATREEI